MYYLKSNNSFYKHTGFAGYTAIFFMVLLIATNSYADRIYKGVIQKMPDRSFFDNCAFVSVDIQPGSKNHMKQIPEGWKANGFTLDDVNAAIDYTYDVCHPNAVKVANACRKINLPMIFIHWGYKFKDGMDLAPDIRQSFVDQFGNDYSKWPHHIDSPDSCPAYEYNVREGEYVIAKTDQDSFTSSNIDFVLKNLGVKNIIFVGGHTGACLGKTAASAKKLGYKILCVIDATNDASESCRIDNIKKTKYDYIISTSKFISITGKISDSE